MLDSRLNIIMCFSFVGNTSVTHFYQINIRNIKLFWSFKHFKILFKIQIKVSILKLNFLIIHWIAKIKLKNGLCEKYTTLKKMQIYHHLKFQFKILNQL